MRQKEPSLLFHNRIGSAGRNGVKNLFSVTEVRRYWAKTPREEKKVLSETAKFTIWHQPCLLFSSVHVAFYSLNCILFHYNISTDGKADGQNKITGFPSNV